VSKRDEVAKEHLEGPSKKQEEKLKRKSSASRRVRPPAWTPRGSGETVHDFVALGHDIILVLRGGKGKKISFLARRRRRTGATTHLKLLHTNNRSEDLLLSDLHVGGNVGEDGRLDEVTLGSVTDSALEHGRALVLARLDVRRDAVVLELGSGGTEAGERLA
jgi:hypothetical protein